MNGLGDKAKEVVISHSFFFFLFWSNIEMFFWSFLENFFWIQKPKKRELFKP